MVFSRYVLTILAIILVIVITSVGLGIYLPRPEFRITVSLFIILLLLETLSLFLYLNRTRKDLLKLIHALKNEDPGLQFRKDLKDPWFSAIHMGFNDIIRNFRLIRTEKEVEHRFFRETVNHISFGMIAFNEAGKIEMVNQAFLELFLLKSIDHIDLLSSVSSDMPAFLKTLNDNDESFRKFQIGNTQRQLILLASKFRLNNETITLVSLRDLTSEIDRNELEAWEKLIRILKHEILNSITPVKLIAGSLVEIIDEGGKALHLSKSDLETIQSGLKTIHSRTTGLSAFLEAYSNLYLVPELLLERIDARKLLERSAELFKNQFIEENIRLELKIPDRELLVEIDVKLIEQVLINLLNNAVQAVQDKSEKIIAMEVRPEKDNLLIEVSDNGTGIDAGQIDNIFVPFYSTVQNGNGIGLSFSRHAMQQHNGYINVNSHPGTGSTFRLVFRSILNKALNPEQST